MSRWSREKHRRKTAFLQSFRDRLTYKITKAIEEKIIYGDGRKNDSIYYGYNSRFICANYSLEEISKDVNIIRPKKKGKK